MEYSRTEIRPGVWLTHLREDKFKTACFSVSLLSQLNRETASMNALIPFVLRRGTSAFPDMETLSARMEELYGTVIEPTTEPSSSPLSVGSARFSAVVFMPVFRKMPFSLRARVS